MIVRITHWLHGSDIETDNIGLEKLQLILTYLQLIKSQMPIFPFTEDFVMPHEATFILAKIYGCKEIDVREFDESIEIKTTPEDILMLEENISEIAKPGARHAFLTCARKQAALELEACAKSEIGRLYPTIKKELEKIDHALATGEVKAERGRVNFEGKKYPSTIFVAGEVDMPRFTNYKIPSLESARFGKKCIDANYDGEIAIRPEVTKWINEMSNVIRNAIGILNSIRLDAYRNGNEILYVSFCNSKSKKSFQLSFYAVDNLDKFTGNNGEQVLVHDLVDALCILRFLIRKIDPSYSAKLGKEENQLRLAV